MLQKLRDTLHGWPAILLFGAMALLLASFGLISYVTQNNATFVAKVGDHEISQRDFQDRMNDLRRQASQAQPGQFDPSYFEKPEVKLQVLDGLIKRQLLLQANKDMGLSVTDEQLRKSIASDPNFQVDGKFNADTYAALLANSGMSAQMYQDRIRASLEPTLIPDAVQASVVLTDQDIDKLLRLVFETRDLRYAMLPRPALTDSSVSDSEIKAWYDKHKADYMTPEQVSINYIELDAKDMKVNTTPSEDDLKQRYEKDKAKFQEPEQRLVSHILIDVPKNATPAQQKAALAKADAIYKKAESGANFAKLAKEYSDDLGSKNQGGDLGWIQRGVTNKAFEDALYSMKKGQISKPVLSPEGYHIIDLRGIRPGKVKPFSEVRDQLAKEMGQGAREREYSKLADKLTNKTYAEPDSLEPAAKELGLKVEHTGLFTRDGTKDGIASNPKVVKAAFSDDVLAQGNNSGAIDLGDNHIVVIHVDKHLPAKQQTLAQVSGKIRQTILDARTAKAAKTQADALLAKVRKGDDLDKVVGPLGAAVQKLDGTQRRHQGVPQDLLDAAFRMPHPAKDKPDFATVDLGDKGYAIVALDAVHPGDLSKVSKPERSFFRQRLTQAYALSEVEGFVDVLRKHTKIEIARERLN